MTSWLYINTRAKRQPRGKTVLTATPYLQTAATGADAGRSGRQGSLLAPGIYCLVKLLPQKHGPPSPTSPRSSPMSRVIHRHPLADSRGTIDWVTYYP